MKLSEVRNEIPTASPGRLSEILVGLGAYFGNLSEELSEILVFKTDVWLELRGREGTKSDRSADRLWDATDKGKREIELRYTLKALEKLMSAIKTMLRTKEQEAQNLY